MAHRPYYVNGKRVPSVTTVLSQFKDPGGLLYWSWNTAYQPLAEAVHAVEALVQAFDRNDSKQLLACRKKAQEFLASKPLQRGDYRAESTEAAAAGTIAHNLVEVWIHSFPSERRNIEKLSPADIARDKNCSLERAKSAQRSFSAFLDWVKSSNFQLFETEQSLVSEEYAYGGTLDCLGWAGDQLVLLDWKTSKAVYYEYLLQLAAYGQLWNENWDPPITGYHLIRFDKTTADFHHHQFAELENELEMFLMLRECYDMKKKSEARVK